jgi:flagellar export protein FliJ
MMIENNVWKTLADKETAKLVELHENKESLYAVKKRLEGRIADIDRYIFEYTSGLKEEPDIEYDVKKINGRMNMITQLMNARSDLEVFNRECNESLGVVTSRLVGHQVELLKFNKVRERQQKQYIVSKNRRDDKELDALALHNFISGMK